MQLSGFIHTIQKAEGSIFHRSRQMASTNEQVKRATACERGFVGLGWQNPHTVSITLLDNDYAFRT